MDMEKIIVRERLKQVLNKLMNEKELCNNVALKEWRYDYKRLILKLVENSKTFGASHVCIIKLLGNDCIKHYREEIKKIHNEVLCKAVKDGFIPENLSSALEWEELEESIPEKKDENNGKSCFLIVIESLF